MMTYDQQLNEVLLCGDKEQARVWLMKEISRYRRDFRKPTATCRRQIIQNLMYTALRRKVESWERVVQLLLP